MRPEVGQDVDPDRVRRFVNERTRLGQRARCVAAGRHGRHALEVGVEAYRERPSLLRMQPEDLLYLDGMPPEVDIYNTPGP